MMKFISNKMFWKNFFQSWQIIVKAKIFDQVLSGLMILTFFFVVAWFLWLKNWIWFIIELIGPEKCLFFWPIKNFRKTSFRFLLFCWFGENILYSLLLLLLFHKMFWKEDTWKDCIVVHSTWHLSIWFGWLSIQKIIIEKINKDVFCRLEEIWNDFYHQHRHFNQFDRILNEIFNQQKFFSHFFGFRFSILVWFSVMLLIKRFLYQIS